MPEQAKNASLYEVHGFPSLLIDKNKYCTVIQFAFFKEMGPRELPRERNQHKTSKPDSARNSRNKQQKIIFNAQNSETDW